MISCGPPQHDRAPSASEPVAQTGLRTLLLDDPTGPDGVADTAGHLADAYHPTDRTLVLLRPDGYVGMISDAGDTAAVARFLRLTTPSPTLRTAPS